MQNTNGENLGESCEKSCERDYGRDTDVSQRLDMLEMRFTYLEDFVKQLQDEVVAESKTIEKLLSENIALKEKIFDLANARDIPNRKPPHY